MRNLSSRWKEKVNNGMDVQYLKYADITLTDGTVLNLTSADLWQNGMTFEDSVSGDSSFDIGSAIINTLTLSINNFDNEYSDYDFDGAEVVCYVGLQVSTEGTSELLDSTGETILDTNNETIIVQTSAEIEKIRICTATVIEQPEDETVTIDLTCEDNMRKFDRDYSDSKLAYPATRGQIIRDACEVCGVTLQTYYFDHDDYIVQTRPSDDALTFRQVLQWVAQIGCQWLRCDEYGRLCVKWYDTESTDVQEIDTTYSFTPQHTDVVITGIQVTEYSDSSDEEPESYVAGTQGYVLAISGNKLIRKGDGQTVASIIAEKCVGMIFRPFESTCLTDVALEAGDAITIEDRNGNLYNAYLTTTTLQPGAGQNIACNAKSAAKNSSTRYSQATQAYVTARKMIKAEKTAREKALEEFGKRIDSATGVYTTEEKQEDGSYIYYLHDKPTLVESKAIWKMTSEAWGVSTDGGKTWNGGMTVDGDTIVRILNAVGVNADWINTGAITVKDADGNIFFQVDMDTKSVLINPDILIIGDTTLSKKINDMDENIASAKNMTMQLSNDMQTITADSDGNIPTFPTVTTTASVLYGSNDITSDCSFTVMKSDSVTGSWSNSTHTYNVTGLSADNGWVDIKATYLVNLSVTKRFTLSKQKQGPQGIQGVGKDGKTTYLHIRYSPVQSPTASQMTTSPDSNTQYIGTYSDFNGTPSTSPSDYTWAKFKGDQGTQGEKGEDGKSSYTWMRYATRPDGLDMSDSPDYVKLLDSTGNPILDSTGAPIYTITQATYLGLATNKDTPVESDDPTDYIWSRFRGVDGYDGKDGADGIPGKDGVDGKTQYTHLAYANSADGKTDFSVDNPNREYIGMYVDFTEADSTDPTKYAWSLIKGADGAEGTPGKAGADGKTPYFHIAYANSADGKTGFSVDDSVDKLYIGQYTDYEKADSTDPTKYSWTLIKGADGAPGRTYYLRANAGILMMGQDKKVNPEKLTVNAYYRDGQGDEKEFAGWWKAERSSDSGETWTTITLNQTEATSACLITSSLQMIGSRGMIRVTCYLDKSKTSIADMQTYSVALDVAALTQEQIVEILSNNGEFKGLYYLNGHLYISFDAIMGNAAILGGAKNGNGYLKIKDASGNIKGLVDYSGFTTFTSYEENSNYLKYAGVQFSSEGIFPVDVEKYFDNTADVEILALELWSIDWSDGLSIDASYGSFSELDCSSGVLNPDVLKISDVFTVKKNLATGDFFYAEFQKELSCRGGIRVYSYPTVTTGYNAYIDINTYQLGKYSSSSERYKVLGDSLSEEFIENLYNIEPIMARYKEGYLEEHDERVGVYFPMFRAEDVDEYFPLAVDHIDGKAENWNERIMIPAMFAMLKSQKKKIDQQEKLINKLYEHLNLEKEI